MPSGQQQSTLAAIPAFQTQSVRDINNAPRRLEGPTSISQVTLQTTTNTNGNGVYGGVPLQRIYFEDARRANTVKAPAKSKSIEDISKRLTSAQEVRQKRKTEDVGERISNYRSGAVSGTYHPRTESVVDHTYTSHLLDNNVRSSITPQNTLAKVQNDKATNNKPVVNTPPNTEASTHQKPNAAPTVITLSSPPQIHTLGRIAVSTAAKHSAKDVPISSLAKAHPSTDEAMPKIVSLYSLHENINTIYASSSPHSAMRVDGWHNKEKASMPQSRASPKLDPTSSARYEQSINKAVADAIEKAEKEEKTKSLKRKRPVPDEARLSKPVNDVAKQRVRHHSNDSNSGPKKSRKKNNNKSKSNVMVPTTFDVVRTSNPVPPNLHRVSGNYPSPIVISKKAVEKRGENLPLRIVRTVPLATVSRSTISGQGRDIGGSEVYSSRNSPVQVVGSSAIATAARLVNSQQHTIEKSISAARISPSVLAKERSLTVKVVNGKSLSPSTVKNQTMPMSNSSAINLAVTLPKAKSGSNLYPVYKSSNMPLISEPKSVSQPVAVPSVLSKVVATERPGSPAKLSDQVDERPLDYSMKTLRKLELEAKAASGGQALVLDLSVQRGGASENVLGNSINATGGGIPPTVSYPSSASLQKVLPCPSPIVPDTSNLDTLCDVALGATEGGFTKFAFSDPANSPVGKRSKSRSPKGTTKHARKSRKPRKAAGFEIDSLLDDAKPLPSNHTKTQESPYLEMITTSQSLVPDVNADEKTDIKEPAAGNGSKSNNSTDIPSGRNASGSKENLVPSKPSDVTPLIQRGLHVSDVEVSEDEGSEATLTAEETSDHCIADIQEESASKHESRGHDKQISDQGTIVESANDKEGSNVGVATQSDVEKSKRDNEKSKSDIEKSKSEHHEAILPETTSADQVTAQTNDLNTVQNKHGDETPDELSVVANNQEKQVDDVETKKNQLIVKPSIQDTPELSLDESSKKDTVKSVETPSKVPSHDEKTELEKSQSVDSQQEHVVDESTVVEKANAVERLPKENDSPNVALCRLNSDEMRNNFSVASRNGVINIRPESLSSIMKSANVDVDEKENAEKPSPDDSSDVKPKDSIEGHSTKNTDSVVNHDSHDQQMCNFSSTEKEGPPKMEECADKNAHPTHTESCDDTSIEKNLVTESERITIAEVKVSVPSRMECFDNVMSGHLPTHGPFLMTRVDSLVSENLLHLNEACCDEYDNMCRNSDIEAIEDFENEDENEDVPNDPETHDLQLDDEKKDIKINQTEVSAEVTLPDAAESKSESENNWLAAKCRIMIMNRNKGSAGRKRRRKKRFRFNIRKRQVAKVLPQPIVKQIEETATELVPPSASVDTTSPEKIHENLPESLKYEASSRAAPETPVKTNIDEEVVTGSGIDETQPNDEIAKKDSVDLVKEKPMSALDESKAAMVLSPTMTPRMSGSETDASPNKRKHQLKLGYNVHSDYSKGDLKVKRRKLVKKDEKPVIIKPVHVSPVKESSSHILLSDSSESSDEGGSFFKTEKVKKKLKDRVYRRSCALMETIREESQNPDETEGVAVKQEPVELRDGTEYHSTIAPTSPSSSNLQIQVSRKESPRPEPIRFFTKFSDRARRIAVVTGVSPRKPSYSNDGTSVVRPTLHSNIILSPKKTVISPVNLDTYDPFAFVEESNATRSPIQSDVEDASMNEEPWNGKAKLSSDDSDIPQRTSICLKSFVRDPSSSKENESNDGFDSQKECQKNCESVDLKDAPKSVKRKGGRKSTKTAGVKRARTVLKHSGKRANSIKTSKPLRGRGGRGRARTYAKRRPRASIVVESQPPVANEIETPVDADSQKKVVEKVKPSQLGVLTNERISNSEEALTATEDAEMNLSNFPVRNNSRPADKNKATVDKKKNTARMMGKWTTQDFPDVEKVGKPPLPYFEPQVKTEVKREENIYLIMQKLLNMGLIMDQMQSGSSGTQEWPNTNDYENEETRLDSEPPLPGSDLRPPADDYHDSEIEVKEEPIWYSYEDFNIKPCSVVLRRLHL